MDNRQILSEIIVQITGFLIVFWILKALAWNRLLGAIEARRKNIQDAFSEIENNKKRLDELEKEYRHKLEHIEQEARAKIQEAAGVGLALAKDIQDKARIDAQKLVDRAQAEIEQDIEKAKLAYRDNLVELSSMMTEKILKEKIDAKEHERLVDRFIKELERV